MSILTLYKIRSILSILLINFDNRRARRSAFRCNRREHGRVSVRLDDLSIVRSGQWQRASIHQRNMRVGFVHPSESLSATQGRTLRSFFFLNSG